MDDHTIEHVSVYVVGPETERYTWASDMHSQYMTNTILRARTRSGLEGIAEEVERHIRVEGGGTRSTAETFVLQPAPPGAGVGEGEVRRIGRSIAQFTWEAGCVCSEIGERYGLDAFGHDRATWSEALERIVEAHGLVRDEFAEDVGGEDLCQRAETQQ